jgi:hypothetical protein
MGISESRCRAETSPELNVKEVIYFGHISALIS